MHASHTVQQSVPELCNIGVSLGAADHITARKDNGIYMYVRRVPKDVQRLHGTSVVRISLSTRDPEEALAKAEILDDSHEALWGALLLGRDAKSSWKKHEAMVSIARSLGFTLRSAKGIVVNETIANALARIDVAEAHIGQEEIVVAVLDGPTGFDPKASEVWQDYYEQKRLDLDGKSKNQLRHHKGQREYAMNTVISVLGDKHLSAYTRADALRYRQHWFDRVVAKEVTKETANRVLSAWRGMLTVIDEAHTVAFGPVWDKLRVKTKNAKGKRIRPPYPLDFVQNEILKPGRMDGLNFEARMIVYVMVETGARPSEICNLRPGDIRLNHRIPHIAIEERDDREQKTEQSIRTIPLVGCALWAARQVPQGFPTYHDKGDSLSATVNKFMLENALRPTKLHVLYSLRHTFQDKLTASGVGDRLQTDIFGHEFDRPKYGEGASLDQKLELLESMKFAWDMATPAHP